jgi:predicted nucleotidyltransferase
MLIRSLRDALDGFPRIEFAFLFGSAVAERLRDDSDLDIAVYLDSGGALEVEAERRHDPQLESAIQLAAERATDRDVDLVILNRAAATVCATAVTSGALILSRNDALRSRYFLAVTGTGSWRRAFGHTARTAIFGEISTAGWKCS